MKGIRMVSAFVLLNFTFPALLLAQGILENPADGSSIGGLTPFSGWVCTATRVEIDVDGSILQAGYPTSRNDTIEACGDDGNNGFSLLINTNLYGAGEHTARLLADGVEIDRATFTVVTFEGQEFVTGVSGQAMAFGFPEVGSNVTLVWQENLQNFVIQSVAADPGDGESPFSAAEFFIEFNSTDEDVGIQVFLDGERWKNVIIIGPDGSRMLEIAGRGGVETQGLTELFFESGEPSLDDVPLDVFLARFPEGEYQFFGQTIEGETLASAATFTHAIPDGPVFVSPAEGAVVDLNDVVISWNPVPDPPDSEIVRYELIVEREDPLRVLSMTLSPTVTSVKVPPEFLIPGAEHNFEVLARETSGNQTLSSSFFETAP